MPENRRIPRLTGEIQAGAFLCAWEEYWEEDDAGFCCVDYVLEKHTRLIIRDAATGVRIREYPFDSREYEKALSWDGSRLTAVFHPSWDRETTVTLDPKTGEILSRDTRADENTG